MPRQREKLSSSGPRSSCSASATTPTRGSPAAPPRRSLSAAAHAPDVRRSSGPEAPPDYSPIEQAPSGGPSSCRRQDAGTHSTTHRDRKHSDQHNRTSRKPHGHSVQVLTQAPQGAKPAGHRASTVYTHPDSMTMAQMNSVGKRAVNDERSLAAQTRPADLPLRVFAARPWVRAGFGGAASPLNDPAPGDLRLVEQQHISHPLERLWHPAESLPVVSKSGDGVVRGRPRSAGDGFAWLYRDDVDTSADRHGQRLDVPLITSDDCIASP